jgi:hypothetical protein
MVEISLTVLYLGFQERKTKVLEIKEKGNTLFRCGSHDEACHLYSNALKICPSIFTEERSMLYNNRAAAKAKQVGSPIDFPQTSQFSKTNEFSFYILI